MVRLRILGLDVVDGERLASYGRRERFEEVLDHHPSPLAFLR